LLPLHQLDPTKVRELSGGKTCYLLCRTGKRATAAAKKLQAAGVTDVVVIEGGILECEAAGFELEKGAAVMSLERQGRLVIGLMVLISSLLAIFVHPSWMWACVFFGAGQVFAAITDFCLLGILLARMPWNNSVASNPGSATSCCTK
jgi:hypothetical protein